MTRMLTVMRFCFGSTYDGFSINGVCIRTLLVYLLVLMNVSRVRSKFEIWGRRRRAYELECAIRSQTNLTEHLVMFLPLLWLCAAIHTDLLAAAIGILFPVGRTIYALRYPDRHRPGFLIQFASEMGLFLAVIIGLIMVAVGA